MLTRPSLSVVHCVLLTLTDVKVSMRALVWSACVLGLGLCGHVSVVQGANKPMHRTLQQQATGGVVRQGE